MHLQEVNGSDSVSEKCTLAIEQLRHNSPVLALQWSHGDLYSGRHPPVVDLVGGNSQKSEQVQHSKGTPCAFLRQQVQGLEDRKLWPEHTAY